MTRRIGQLVVMVLVQSLASACISVGDYGPFWKKDRLDGSLEGVWDLVEPGDRGPVEMRVVRRGTQFKVTTHRSKPSVGRNPEEARTLRVGATSFMMLRFEDGPGFITPYEINADRLTFFDLMPAAALPDAPPPPPSAKYSEGSAEAPPNVEIGRLDQEALDWLTQLSRHARPASVYVRRR